MGTLVRGHASKAAVALAKTVQANVFIETGTLRGGTTAWASTQFDTVHTIERAEELYKEASNNLKDFPGVSTHLGDSRTVLPGILESIGSAPAVFWLDGHWSGGTTAGADDECPLMEELELIKDRENDIVLIDDARMFLCAPHQPHKAEQWPTIPDIVSIYDILPGKRFMQIVDDIIYIVPAGGDAQNTLVNHSQEFATAAFKKFVQSINN